MDIFLHLCKIAEDFPTTKVDILDFNKNELEPFSGSIKISHDSDFYCSICKKKFTSKNTFQTHEQTASHQKKLLTSSPNASSGASPSKNSSQNQKIKIQILQKLQQNIRLLSENPNQILKLFYQSATELIKMNFFESAKVVLQGTSKQAINGNIYLLIKLIFQN